MEMYLILVVIKIMEKFMKGQPLNRGSATMIQSGELFQKSPLDINGCLKFERVAEEKSVN